MQVPFIRLDRQFNNISKEILCSISAVLEKGQVLQGSEVEQLESRLAQIHNLKHGIATNSGTDALIFAIACLGLKEGSRIAVPAMTFIASGSSILHNRCCPVFVDIDPDTMLMDKGALLELVRQKKIDAIIAVHLYGQMMDLEDVYLQAHQKGIALIEDAAQALGSTHLGHPPGRYSDITCLSFDPVKVIGAYGSGGAILTNNDRFAETARLLRYHGHIGNSVYQCPGFNSQMDSIQAAIIDIKLNYLEQWQARRTEIAARFSQCLAQTPHVRLLKTLPDNVPNFHKFVISALDRENLQHHLKATWIQTKVHYPVPLHQQPCFLQGSVPLTLVHVEKAAKTILSLPMYADLKNNEVDYIVTSILEFYENRH